MGHSPTGQHVIKVWLNDACSVITSNKWEEELSKLPHGDSQWLIANSHVFTVKSPLWLP